MNQPSKTKKPSRSLQSTILCRAPFVTGFLSLLPSVLAAQDTPGSNIGQTVTATSQSPTDQVTTMDPFVVPTENGVGYYSSQSAIGTMVVKPLMNVPSSIYVVNHELISDLAATYAGEALKYGAPGVSSVQDNDDSFNIRGFNSGYTLRDGVVLYSNQKNPMYDIDRLEVIKGPTAMLLGSAQYIGGAINYVPKEPTRTFQADADVTVGASPDYHSYERYVGDVSGPVYKSADFTALYRLTVGGETGKPTTPTNTTGQKFIGLGTTFEFFNRKLRLETNSYYFDNRTMDYWPDFLDVSSARGPFLYDQFADPLGPGGAAVLNPRSTRSFAMAPASQNFWSSYNKYFAAIFSGNLTKNASFRAYFGYYSQHQEAREIRGNYVFPDNVTIGRDDIIFNYAHGTREVQLQYLYRTVMTWWNNDFQVGIENDWFRTVQETGVDQGSAFVPPPDLNAASPNYALPYNVNPIQWNKPSTFANAGATDAIDTGGSYWVQDNLSFFKDKITLLGGLRWASDGTVTTNLISGSLKQVTNPRVKTHRYGVVLTPLSGISVYYCDAQNLTPVIGTNGYGQPFRPSAGELKEGGIKLQQNVDAISFYGSFAYFNMNQTNIKTNFVDPVLGNVVVQTTLPSNSKGWETEIGGRLATATGHADLIATYYKDKTFRADTGGVEPDAPGNTFSLFIKYAWTSTIARGLMVGAGCYNESTKLEGDNYTVNWPVTYSILAGYRINKHLELQLNGNNVTNERYVANVIDSALVQASRPAEYLLSVKWNY